MSAEDLTLAINRLEELYAGDAGDPDFTQVSRYVQVKGDDALADLIEADGRLRLRLRRPVTLDRYLDAYPDLPRRAVVLDAAIDMTLRALARTSPVTVEDIERLVAEHPALESSIRASVAITEVMWSTQRVDRAMATGSRPLPCPFGPPLNDGGPRYELRELLGEGSFGQVYLAVDRQLSEDEHEALVSIKILIDDGSEWTRQRLAEEATKARRIDHPAVVRVLDRGVTDDDESFVVYEFIDGGHLGRWARSRSPVPVADGARMMARIARGVHAAHMAGLVHCDLKPSNIVLTHEGAPKVADFGIAVRTGEETTTATARSGDGFDGSATEPLGNLAFMSPEQFRMEPGGLTIPSDIYSLGGVLFWLLTTRFPNGATREEIAATHDRRTGRRQPPQVRPHRRAVDPDLEAICQRAMAVDPADRHPAAAAFADDLEAWLARKPIAWRTPPWWRRLRLWTRRSPALAAAAACIVILAVVGAFTLQNATVHKLARRESRDIMDEFIGGLVQAEEAGLAYQLLPVVWLTEWLYGPQVLGEGPGRFELWRMRKDLVRQLLQRAQRDERENHVELLIWETALAFWLVCDHEDAEAESILAGNIAGWRGILAENDPWLVHLAGLRACARVGVLAGGEGEADRDELLALELALAAASQSLASGPPGAPLHLLILERQSVLYGPELLDDGQRRALMQQLHDELGQISLMPEASP